MTSPAALPPSDVRAGAGNGPDATVDATVASVLAPLRVPGGTATVRAVLREAAAHDRVLGLADDGGAAVLEIAATTRTHTYGVDADASAVRDARVRASADGVRHAHFQHADPASLPYAAGSFDLVFGGDLGSSLTDRRVLREAHRVLHRHGTVALTPWYLHREPPRSLLAALADSVLGVPSPGGLAARRRAYESTGAELIVAEEYAFDEVDVARLSAEADACARSAGLTSQLAIAVGRRVQRELAIVAEVLPYTRHAVLLYRPRRGATPTVSARSTPVPGSRYRP